MTLRRLLAAVFTALLLGVLAACARPGILLMVGGSPVSPALHGRVDVARFGGRSGTAAWRTVQATTSDVATYATVSIIDTATNQTIATTVTDGAGNFALSLNAFTPQAGHAYYLEAVKGLNNNVPGKRTARLRTILSFSGGWLSLTGATPNAPVIIDASTTALSVVVSLRALTADPVNATTLMGALQVGTPDTAATPTTDDRFLLASNVLPGISQGEFHQAWGELTDVLANNGDPVAGVLINTTRNGAAPWYTYYEASVGFQINSMSPTSGPIGTTVTLLGANFSPAIFNNQVKFSSAPTRNPTDYVAISSDYSQLQVKVPPGATTGPVSLQIGTIAGYGPTFTVTSNDGHQILDAAGNLYVVGNQGAIFKLTPAGAMVPFATDASWGQVTLDGAGNVYVADLSANAVYKYSPTGVQSVYCNSGLNGPIGLVFDPTGNLYVSNYWAGTVVRIPPGGGAPGAFASGFSGPIGIGFDPNTGNLFVANSTNNTVSKVASPSGAVTTYAAGFHTPYGLAIDTWGNLFVANQGGSEVSKVDTSANVTTYAARYVQPRSLAFDPAGNLYVATTNNALYKRSSAGAETLLASAFSSPWGLVFDGSGNLFGVGQGTNNVVEVATPSTTAQFLANVNAPSGVATDSAGNLYIASGGNDILKVPAGSGAIAPWAVLSDSPNGLATDPAGAIYGAMNNAHQIWKFDSSGNPTTWAWSPCKQPVALATDSANVYYCNAGGSGSGSNTGSVFKFNGTRAFPLLTGLPDPRGLAVDPTGTYLYVSSFTNNTVGRYTLGTGIWNPTWGTGCAASPQGMVCDPSGNLYVGMTNGNVAKFSSAGGAANNLGCTGAGNVTALTIAPNGWLYSSDWSNANVYRFPPGGGAAQVYVTGAGLSQAQGITFDGPSQNLYVCCKGNGQLQKVASGSTPTVSTFMANLNQADGVLFDPSINKLYVVEQGNNSLETFDLTQSRTMLEQDWGTIQGLGFDPSGNLWVAGTNYEFQISPAGGVQEYVNWHAGQRGIVCDPSGNVYVANPVDGTILKGTAGTPTSFTNWVTGLNQPYGLALDPSKTSLLVTEYGAHDVKRVNLSSGAVTNTPFWPYGPTF